MFPRRVLGRCCSITASDTLETMRGTMRRETVAIILIHSVGRKVLLNHGPMVTTLLGAMWVHKTGRIRIWNTIAWRSRRVCYIWVRRSAGVRHWVKVWRTALISRDELLILRSNGVWNVVIKVGSNVGSVWSNWPRLWRPGLIRCVARRCDCWSFMLPTGSHLMG
jgi:hypothetical protein